jgi:hypothetical protein
VRPGGLCGSGAVTKVTCLVAGMAAGADSIDDMDLLRDGAMGAVFAGVRAPSTLGSHLRSYAWGNVRQLGKAHRGLLVTLARDRRLLPGSETLTFIDIDSTQKRVFGYQKEGAAFGIRLSPCGWLALRRPHGVTFYANIQRELSPVALPL